MLLCLLIYILGIQLWPYIFVPFVDDHAFDVIWYMLCEQFTSTCISDVHMTKAYGPTGSLLVIKSVKQQIHALKQR